MKYAITSKKAYHETMVSVYNLMSKGENNLTAKELKLLEAMLHSYWITPECEYTPKIRTLIAQMTHL